MVNLDSPILTLGALFMAGNSSEGRNFTGGETGKGLIAGGFASSSAQTVVDGARKMAGLEESAVSDELAQALLGAGLSRFGGPIPQNNAMARGIHYNVAHEAFTKAGWTLGEMMNGGGGGTQPSPSQASRSAQKTHTPSHGSDGDTVVF